MKLTSDNGPVRMPHAQALKIITLIQLLYRVVIPHFPLLALWGSKKWPPTMKEKTMLIFGNKNSLGNKN